MKLFDILKLELKVIGYELADKYSLLGAISSVPVFDRCAFHTNVAKFYAQLYALTGSEEYKVAAQHRANIADRVELLTRGKAETLAKLIVYEQPSRLEMP